MSTKSQSVNNGTKYHLNPETETLSQAELAEIWARRAMELAQEPPAPAVGQTIDLLIFRLNHEKYGINVSNVREIFPLTQLTPVPRTPNFVTGVFSARGRILSVIDLCAFLGLPGSGLSKKENSDQAKIIVVTNTSTSSKTAFMEIGILAHEVSDVMTIFKKELDPPLATHTGIQAKYQQGITADLMIVLNLNALLGDEHLIIYDEIL